MRISSRRSALVSSNANCQRCDGRLRFVEPGAPADITPVYGDPPANLKRVEKPEENFSIITKDGRTYKDALA